MARACMRPGPPTCPSSAYARARHYASRGMSALAGGRHAQIQMSAITAHAQAARYAVEIVKDLVNCHTYKRALTSRGTCSGVGCNAGVAPSNKRSANARVATLSSGTAVISQ